MKNTRRAFIRQTGMAGFLLGTGSIGNSMNGILHSNSPAAPFAFMSPVDGDMLCSYDGEVTPGGLKIHVTITGPAGLSLSVNGKGAGYKDGRYNADILLGDYRNTIEVKEVNSDKRQSIVVFWLKNYAGKYRLSLDDNIWFLKDIADHADVYRSIFENPYLGFFRQVHELYGTKVHFNLYYQTEGFNLSEFPDKYKGEWKDNAGWLRLSFHALQNDPDMPYKNAGYDTVKKDCELVMDQIRRFAGEELMDQVTTLHWGEATVEGCRALRDSGYTALAGYFNLEKEPVSYYLEGEQRKHLNQRFIWRDNREGIIFNRIALVINTIPLEQVVPFLDGLRSGSRKPAYVDLMIHEQYFYPFYRDYQPDYGQKVLSSVKWAEENGYKPAFLSECIFS